MGQDRQGERLEQLYELARIARGWSRAQLAEALGRDVSRLTPPSGNPKLDLVVKLAEVLEWPVGDVVSALCPVTDRVSAVPTDDLAELVSGLDGDGLYYLALDLRKRGRHHDLIRVGQLMRDPKHSRQVVAEGWAMEAASWISLGRYTHAIEAACHGLALADVPRWLRQNLTYNLAEALAAIQRSPLAFGLCDSTLRELDVCGNPETNADIFHRTILTSLRGRLHRSLAMLHPDESARRLPLAEDDLRAAIQLCEQNADLLPDTALPAEKVECEFALLSVLVEMGRSDPASAVMRILKWLDPFTDLSTVDTEMAEAVGWVCVFGCEIAVRHMADEDRQRTIAVLSNKIVEAADVLDHWHLRERALTLQYSAAGPEQVSLHPSLDDADRANIVATMSRFPEFRSIGWQLLAPPGEEWV